jgi:predicted enzyme related to lactoylglutathione lyase
MDFALAVVRIFVSDWERAIHFYTETLGIPTSYRSDEYGWAELDTGAAKLALERVAPGDTEGQSLTGRFVGVSLRVADVDATYVLLSKRGVEFPGIPREQPWGGMLAHLSDPDGNVLTLLGAAESSPNS